MKQVLKSLEKWGLIQKLDILLIFEDIKQTSKSSFKQLVKDSDRILPSNSTVK